MTNQRIMALGKENIPKSPLSSRRIMALGKENSPKSPLSRRRIMALGKEKSPQTLKSPKRKSSSRRSRFPYTPSPLLLQDYVNLPSICECEVPCTDCLVHQELLHSLEDAILAVPEDTTLPDSPVAYQCAVSGTNDAPSLDNSPKISSTSISSTSPTSCGKVIPV